MWGSGFLPSRHQGAKLRSGAEPVLYLNDPPGLDRAARREWLDTLNALNARRLREVQDPEIATRIAQYEMAYRMQTSVPELTDLAGETDATYQLYGATARQPGTKSNNLAPVFSFPAPSRASPIPVVWIGWFSARRRDR